ncbi:MAG: transposase [Chloroflexaceae bacterium]|nr:transposase [Chloroflexaceae bacterium]
MKEAGKIYCEVISIICSHLDGICNYFRNRTTNGVMEGINNRIKLIKRQAYGARPNSGLKRYKQPLNYEMKRKRSSCGVLK